MIALDRTIGVLAEMPLFHRIDAKRLKVIAMMGESLRYEDGEEVFASGEEGDSAYVVVDGEAAVIVGTGSAERAITDIRQGELFGEMAVLTDRPRSTGIRAIGRLEVLRLEKTAMLSLLKEFPDFAIELVRIVAERLETATQRLATAEAALDGAPTG